MTSSLETNLFMKITGQDIKDTVHQVQQLMNAHGLTHFYISSSDPYLNEYVPLKLCPRYHFTNFSGSTGEILLTPSGKVQLFVDGRYHEQADKEVDKALVDVIKVKNKGLKESVLKAIPNTARVGYQPIRTPLKFANDLSQQCQLLHPIKGPDDPLAQLVPLFPPSPLPPLENLEGKLNLSSVAEKIKRVYQELNLRKDEALYLNALDQIAWISNLRGYHLPNASTFLGRAILTSSKLHLLLEPRIEVADTSRWIQVHKIENNDLPIALESLKKSFQTLLYDEGSTNASDYQCLLETLGEQTLAHKNGGLIPVMSIKDQREIVLIQDSFNRSNQAITQVLNWIRSSMEKGNEISELDIYNKTTTCYREQGAKDQSFNTISGVGPHSSIIHFSSPEANVKVKKEDVVLLDSGGYFSSGYATDTTRTILAHRGSTPHPKLLKICTIALKGMLRLQNAVVPEGVSGNELDDIARKPIRDAGYDYNHGTGHGVGIYVHEGGISISTHSKHHKIKVGHVVSIEPGIYLPEFGGVRHENIVVVRPHPKQRGYVYFEPLTWIEFDEQLIDRSQLNSQEITWLDEYQTQCQNRGNTL